MLRAAILFFVVGLIAFALGAGNIGGLSIEIGRMVFIGFLILSVISFALSLLGGGRRTPLKSLGFALCAGLLAGSFQVPHAVAADTTSDHLENEMEEQQTRDRLGVRKQKKDIRDTTDNRRLIEDDKDESWEAREKATKERQRSKRGTY